MTTRAIFRLFPLFWALLPACGQAGDVGSAGGPGAPRAADSASAGAAGANSLAGAAGSSLPVIGDAPATSAGERGVSEAPPAGGSSGLAATPPPTWNSAKSAAISVAQLEAEYAAWKLAHVEACPNGSQVVVKDGEVVSEGIAYGMLLSVAMADQPLFDGFWKYYQDHLDKNGLMNWKTSKCEAPGNNNANAATDADLDATMALVQASARWPSAPGSYLARAEALAAKITQFESDMCDGRRILRPGDAFGGCSDARDPRINPSYFSPGYYKVFAHYFSAQAATWSALSDASYQLFAVYQARMDNLVPDWSAADGSDSGGQYWYDACRTPWRVAVDYAWTGDTRAKTFMTNISSWVDAHGGLPHAAQQQNSAFIGAFALAGAYDQGKFDGYMAAWLGAQLEDTPYYQGTLRVLYLLVAAGKFSSTL
jgi:endo-1,4-beta-D-glucanase Y